MLLLNPVWGKKEESVNKGSFFVVFDHVNVINMLEKMQTKLTSISGNSGKLNAWLNRETKYPIEGISGHDWISIKFIWIISAWMDSQWIAVRAGAKKNEREKIFHNFNNICINIVSLLIGDSRSRRRHKYIWVSHINTHYSLRRHRTIFSNLHWLSLSALRWK